MIYLSQRDPRWSTTRIGSSLLTLGRYGCTTTCLAMLSDLFGKLMLPNQIAAQKKWFTPQGLVMWQNLAIPGMKFNKRIRFRSDAEIMKTLQNPNSAVILQVNHGQHWVVAVRKTWIKNDYICVDPWTGKTCAAVADYHNITGSAHFDRA